MKRDSRLRFALCALFLLFAQRDHQTVAAEQISTGDSPVGSLPLVQNFLKITDRFFCGGEPTTDASYSYLASRGIKTIVSVDGARPDVESARRHGLRHVHIPIGYDGLTEQARLSLAQLVRLSEGPFYVHCHHGRHRGPTAAAVAAIAAREIDHQTALKVLSKAGTSKDYGGLWRAVELFRIPTEDVELPALVETAELSSIASAMAQIDRAYERLGQCRDAGWKTPPNHPDLVPRQQTLLLKEGFRESRRGSSEIIGEELSSWMGEAESIVQKLEDALRTKDLRAAKTSFRDLSQSCIRCHREHRN